MKHAGYIISVFKYILISHDVNKVSQIAFPLKSFKLRATVSNILQFTSSPLQRFAESFYWQDSFTMNS